MQMFNSSPPSKVSKIKVKVVRVSRAELASQVKLPWLRLLPGVGASFRGNAENLVVNRATRLALAALR